LNPRDLQNKSRSIAAGLQLPISSCSKSVIAQMSEGQGQPPAQLAAPGQDQRAQSQACGTAKKDMEFVSSIRTLSLEAMRDRMNAATASVMPRVEAHCPCRRCRCSRKSPVVMPTFAMIPKVECM
jgi:hypothetical protein